jgi:dTDP-glucose pyrophosphorylase/predicted transcriptional regulator
MTRVDSWTKTLLSPVGSIGDAIKILNDTALRIVLVADSDLKLVGTVTDGDIRRGLLRDLTLASPISEVINTKPIVVPQNFAREVVLEIMSSHKIFQIPVVDEGLKLVGLHVRNEQNTHAARDNVVVIMAGGKGTRLLPKTEKMPKPMLRLGVKPILEHIIERAKAEGFSRFVLAIHHLGEVIEEYFGDGKSLGVNISYVKEKTPLGTAGALSLIEPKPSQPIIVTNGDVLTDVKYGDILDFHNHSNGKATMAVQVREWQNPYGVVNTDGIEITNYEEKPVTRTLINAGVYVVNPTVLGLLTSSTPCDMPLLFELARAKGMKTVAYLAHESWIDVGTHEDFNLASGQNQVIE